MATVNIKESTFEKTITDNEIVFIDFWAEWCGPCRNFAPVYDKVSEQHPDVTFAKVDTEAEQGLAAAAGITSIPTLMAFRDRVLVFSQPGALPESNFEELVQAVKGLNMEEVHAQIAAQKEASDKQ
jgi:thioredoxin 1